MPNFDAFERLFRSVLASDLSNDEGAMRIFLLPEENKVKIVKGRNHSELVNFLARAKSSLKSYFSGESEFTYTDDNLKGKDLYEVNTRTHIELKSSKLMTDANSGLSTIAWAIDDASGRLAEVTKIGVRERRGLLMRGAPKLTIEESKKTTMNLLLEIFGEKLPVGLAPERLSHYIRCVSVGLTKKREIVKSFREENLEKSPLMLEADWSAGLVRYSKALQADEAIEIIRIEKTPDRFQILAKGLKTSRIVRLYPNYKNSWTAPNGIRYEASNWVNNPCFQVWIQ